MFDLNTLIPAGAAARMPLGLAAQLATPTAPAYRGPERRSAASQGSRWLSLMLDEIDYGMVLLSDSGQVLHVNHAARAELDSEHPLQLLGREVRARLATDVAPLADALQAAQRGLRRLITLGGRGSTLTLAVVPLGALANGAPQATLLLLGKRRVCERLSVQWFARAHALTPARPACSKACAAGSTRAKWPSSTAWAWPRCARRSARYAPRPAPRASVTWCSAWRYCRRW
jgi:hypothetical protein